MTGARGIVVNAVPSDALAFLADAARSKGAVKALKQGLGGLRLDAERAGRSLGRMAGSLKGVTAALMQTATVSAGLDKGMMNLYRWSKTGYRAFAQSLNLLATDALYLKNSLAALASPLVSAVTPAISFVTARFADAFNVVNQLMARLSGASTYVAAKKTADAWDSTGGRITQAAGALRRYVAGFDQLNVLSTSGGGAAGSAGAGDMFETRQIESDIADFADRLKAAFEAGDWQGLGQTLGRRLNEAVANVDWQGLGEKLGGHIDGAVRTANAFLKEVSFIAIGEKLGTFLSAAVSRIDFGELGETIGRLLVAGVEVAAGAVSAFDWSELGGKLAQGLNGFLGALNTSLDEVDWGALAGRLTAGMNRFIADVDWKGAGEGLGRRVNDVIAFCKRAVEDFDWAASGRALSNGLNGLIKTVDWTGLGQWLNRTLNGVLDFGIGFLDSFDAEGLAAGLRAALEQVDWDGVAAKLWTLFKTALGKLGEAAKTLLLGGTVSSSFSIGLLRDGWSTVSAWVNALKGTTAVSQSVGLSKAWSTVSAWVNSLKGTTAVSQNVGLAKAWSTVSAWVNSLKGTTAVNQSVGLAKAWSTVSAWVSSLKGTTAVNQSVGLTKTWSSVSSWVSGLKGSVAVSQTVGLSRAWDWQSVSEWVSARMGSTDTDQTVGLKQNAWKTVSKWVGGYMGSAVDQKVALAKNWSGTPQKALSLDKLTTTVKVGLEIDSKKKDVKISGGISKGSVTLQYKALGGIITAAGRALSFATGGVLRGGRPNWWNSVNKYAAGTGRAHGTVFVAGEAGPEVVGHVNGRTEILNKSQLAQAIYGAVVAGMGQAVNALGRYLAGHMTACANAIAATVGALGVVPEYRVPVMASGAVLPYAITAQLERSAAQLQGTLNANNEDLIQTVISVIGAQTSALVSAIQAIQGGAGRPGGGSAQQLIDEINRRTQMFGASPLKGV